MLNYVFDKTFFKAHFISLEMLTQYPRFGISFHARGTDTQATRTCHFQAFHLYTIQCLLRIRFCNTKVCRQPF